MIHESRRYLVAAVISMLVILATAAMTHDDPGRAHPDRDDTRVDHIVDLQLPTL